MTSDPRQNLTADWLPTTEDVQQVVQLAAAITQPSRIFLYPAWEGDEATGESDLNIAIFMPAPAAARMADLRRALKAKLEEMPLQVEVLMATEEFAQSRFNHPAQVFFHIFREGRLAWEQE